MVSIIGRLENNINKKYKLKKAIIKMDSFLELGVLHLNKEIERI